MEETGRVYPGKGWHRAAQGARSVRKGAVQYLQHPFLLLQLILSLSELFRTYVNREQLIDARSILRRGVLVDFPPPSALPQGESLTPSSRSVQF